MQLMVRSNLFILFEHVSVQFNFNAVVNMFNVANQYKYEEADKVYVHSIKVMLRLPDQNWTKLRLNRILTVSDILYEETVL